MLEPAGDEVGHVDEIPCRAIAAGAGLGRLDQAVDGFDTAIGQPAVKPVQDTVPVRLKRSGELAEGCEAGSLRPCEPRGQQLRGLGLAVGLREDVPQPFFIRNARAVLSLRRDRSWCCAICVFVQ